MIWRTDGLARILDIHGAEAFPAYAGQIDIDIHSLAGDLILGGSYLRKELIYDWPNSFSSVFDRMWCKSPFVSQEDASDLLRQVVDDYRRLPHSDYFFLDARVRRFTNCGTIALNYIIERRFPTYDLQLMSFVYSLPDRLRFGSKLYKAMLLKYFPEYYEHIPWQKTGLSIGASNWRHNLSRAAALPRRAIRYLSGNSGVGVTGHTGFTDYPRWLRTKHAIQFTRQLLCGHDALSSAYLDRDIVAEVVASFTEKNSNRFLRTLSLLLTFEIYLRQLADGPESCGTSNLIPVSCGTASEL